MAHSERYKKSVTHSVKSSLMDAPIPAIEAPILIPKPIVSRSTVGKIYDKTKSVINKFARWIEGAIPEEPKRVVNDKLEKLKTQVNSIFGKLAKNKLEIRESNSAIKGFTKQQYTTCGTQGVDAVFSCRCKTTGCQLVVGHATNKGQFGS